jgi:ribonuclease P protein subunit RPR2
MPAWLEWLLLGLAFGLAIAAVVGYAFRRVAIRSERPGAHIPRAAVPVEPVAGVTERPRILIVDDDPSFRSLLVATLAGEAMELVEAETAEEARSLALSHRPDLVLLDVSLPDASGLVFCAELRELDDAPRVVLLTGADVTEDAGRLAGAEAVLRKPFSPLELLDVIDRLITPAAATGAVLPAQRETLEDREQLIVYARDLARVIEIERAQRHLLENAYRQTLSALASALDARDTGTHIHSLRVTRYALELAGQTSQELLDDPTVVYGFLLHDIGKIGIPDSILLKRGPLDPVERREMQRHPEIGETILGGVAILQGEGLEIVRSHHERWDGTGYPDGLAGEAIPRGARIFAVADALDALTNDRPYRTAREWDFAIEEIGREAGRQFDPEVVDALLREEHTLRSIHNEIAHAA